MHCYRLFSVAIVVMMQHTNPRSMMFMTISYDRCICRKKPVSKAAAPSNLRIFRIIFVLIQALLFGIEFFTPYPYPILKKLEPELIVPIGIANGI